MYLQFKVPLCSGFVMLISFLLTVQQTVNSNLKRTENDLSELNSIIQDINVDARTTAPNLAIMVGVTAKKSPSPMRQRLFKNVPKVYGIRGSGSNKPVPSTPPLEEEPQQGTQQQLTEVPEAKPEGQGAERKDTPTDTGPSRIPEAQPVAP